MNGSNAGALCASLGVSYCEGKCIEHSLILLLPPAGVIVARILPVACFLSDYAHKMSTYDTYCLLSSFRTCIEFDGESRNEMTITYPTGLSP